MFSACSPQKMVGSVAQLKCVYTNTHSMGNKAGSWKPLHSRKTGTQLLPQKLGGMNGTTGGLQWMARNSAGGIGGVGGDVLLAGCLGTDHKVRVCNCQQGRRELSTSDTSHLACSGDGLTEPLEGTVLKGKGVQESWTFSKEILKAQEQGRLSPCTKR